ncbi:hypothetical protein, partial [Metamycoplasma auris]
MNKENLDFLKINLNEYNSSFNLMHKFFVPKKLLSFYQNVENKEVEAFNQLAGSILNQINLLVGQRIEFYLNCSSSLDEFIKQVGNTRYNNLKTAIFEEIKYRLLSNNFPEFFNQEKILSNNLQRVGNARDFVNLENYLCPTASVLIINAAWHKLELPKIDELLNLKDLIANQQKIIESEINLKQTKFQSDFNSKQEKINESIKKDISSAKENIDSKIKLFENNINTILLAINKNELRDSEIIGRYNSLQKELKDLTLNEISKIKILNEEQNASIKSVKELIKNNELNVDKNSQIIKRNSGSIYEFKSDLDIKSNLIKQLEKKLSNLTKYASDINSSNSLHGKQIQSLQNSMPGRIENAKETLRSYVDAEVKKLVTYLTDLQNNFNPQIRVLESRVSDLDKKLNQISNSINKVSLNERLLKDVEQKLKSGLEKIDNFERTMDDLINFKSATIPMLAQLLYEEHREKIKADLTDDPNYPKYKLYQFLESENTYKFIVARHEVSSPDTG